MIVSIFLRGGATLNFAYNLVFTDPVTATFLSFILELTFLGNGAAFFEGAAFAAFFGAAFAGFLTLRLLLPAFLICFFAPCLRYRLWD